jgi:cytosine/adenosine deaminase-related metal-dependent hydrolase
VLLRARTVLPICAPPIDDGAVLVRGEHIEAVGKFSELKTARGDEVIDLGESILLPGLINAHCHLDYTDMAGKLFPAKYFSDWIKSIVALKAEWSYTDFAESWLNGANQLLRSGTTTVVDIEAVPELLPEVTRSTPLRVVSCLELISIRSRQTAEQMAGAAVAKIQSLPPGSAALSPHAPYSISPELLRAIVMAGRTNGWLITTHVAESADEFEMFRHARGAMFSWLRSQRGANDCGGISPVAWLARNEALSPNFLAVHANYLALGDADLLARSGASVVHCPRSHAFFRHQGFPVADLMNAGVNICLGTDSMATMPRSRSEPFSLNMFSEMRALSGSFPELSPRQILEMATVNAARALGRKGELGSLAPGAVADLIAVPRGDATDPEAVVLNHRGDVTASMIRGAWAVAPGYA